MTRLERLSIRGFKSIRELKDFELSNLNVLVGANGAGKSNFISLFRMLEMMVERRLQWYVRERGVDALLFRGRKQTREIDLDLEFDRGRYHFALVPFADRLIFSREQPDFGDAGLRVPPVLGDLYPEAFLHEFVDAFPALEELRVFHFHDTSREAGIRNAQPVRDNLLLKEDGSNLAPFLRMLSQKYGDEYRVILETIRIVAPYFDDLVHRDDVGLDDRIDLEWREVDDRQTPRSPLQLSDGTIRFICLVTLLLQPERLQPSMILIDEPELGLHPYAVVILSSLLQRASETRQIIVSTQSVELVNQLAPEDVIIVERFDGASVFRRLDADSLKNWLDDYTLGELWKMNVVGGSPTR